MLKRLGFRAPLSLYLVQLTMFLVVCQCETVKPRFFVQVHQHPLFQLVLAVVDGDGVVVPVQAVNQCLDGGLVQVTQHGGGLSGRIFYHTVMIETRIPPIF